MKLNPGFGRNSHRGSSRDCRFAPSFVVVWKGCTLLLLNLLQRTGILFGKRGLNGGRLAVLVTVR